MADTKTVHYGSDTDGPYETEVAEKDAEEFARNVGGYIVGSDGDPNPVTVEDDTVATEAEYPTAPQYPAPTSQTPIYDGIPRPAGQ